jgi:prepilin-type N-terminal cleavage/methylation domain-containing protein
MKMKIQVSGFRFQVSQRRQPLRGSFNLGPSTFNLASAFTLIELLVVISIMGILAALTVPALKNMGKSNIQVSATRQLLEDIGHARLLAISQHTTVYMVFVTTNFFNENNSYGENIVVGLNSATRIPLASDRQAALVALTNLVDKQLTGYNFIARGRVGDQPGQHAWHYLDDWKSLPDGTFISPVKFSSLQNASLPIPLWLQYYGTQIDAWRNYPQIYAFTNAYIPFPTEKAPPVWMPYLAFSQTGQLISETSDNTSFHHAYIPLVQGSVSYGIDVNKHPTLTPVQPGDITEIPPGNSTNIAYNVIDIDPLTGRATQQQFKMQ